MYIRIYIKATYILKVNSQRQNNLKLLINFTNFKNSLH